MHIVAHSLGGYLSTAYALRYPHLVKNLILLSPAGIPAFPTSHGPQSKPPASEVQPNHSPLDEDLHDSQAVNDAFVMESGLAGGTDPKSERAVSLDAGERDGWVPTMRRGTSHDSALREQEEEEDEEEGATAPQTFKGPLGKSGKLARKLYAYMWEVSSFIWLYRELCRSHNETIRFFL